MTDEKKSNSCDNLDHDWNDERFCETCNLPIKQYRGQEAVDMMHKLLEDLNK